jgi:hypothetical protein
LQSAPEIKGFLASGPAFEDIAVIGPEPTHKLAMFCATCFDKRILAKYPKKN